MREIKFRGYSSEKLIGSQWVYGCGVDYVEFAEHFSKEVGRPGDRLIITEDGWKKVQEGSVGQYTGLKDKEENEIYEGDIIHFKRKGDFLGADMMLVVEYYKGCFCAGTLQWDYVLKYGVVVGNIYENPELIK